MNMPNGISSTGVVSAMNATIYYSDVVVITPDFLRTFGFRV